MTPNYKIISKLQLSNFLELTKEFTFGEALYSVMRKIEKPTGTCMGWVKDISDEQWYQAIEKATKEEKEYTNES